MTRAMLCPLLLLGCAGEPTTGEREPTVVVRESVRVVPSDAIPSTIRPQDANNNLDVTWHEGRLWLAWRSAPTHFASADTRMHVVSRLPDEATWRDEGTFHLGTDLREPQLVSTPDGLVLYMATLGTNPLAFEPGGSVVSAYRGPGDWSEPEAVFPDDFIPWRIEEGPDGGFEVMGYTGGGNIYAFDGTRIRILWLVSEDGRTWSPHPDAGEDGEVLQGGGSETSLVHLDDGSIVAVVRNEAGDEDGFGSKICTAPADDLGTWTCGLDPRKFDSPLVLRDAGGVWLIARRNVTEDGHYDLGQTDLPVEEQALNYQAAYWNERKRCAIWSVDPEARTVTWLQDLPSRGDTCFPSAVRAPDDAGWWLFDYTNDPDGDDLVWLQGQTSPTFVYRHDIRFE